VFCCRECLLWRVSAIESVCCGECLAVESACYTRVPAIQEFLLYKRVCYTRVCPNLKKEFLDVARNAKEMSCSCSYSIYDIYRV
jgi:hypothetical protein